MRRALKTPVLAIVMAASVARLPGPPVSAAPPIPPSGFRVVDLIVNHDFEDPSAATSFKALSGSDSDGTVVRTTERPIAGTASVRLGVKAYGRIGNFHDLGWQSGRFADSVVFEAKVRVDGSAAGTGDVKVCAIVYFHDDSVPRSTC